MTPNESVKLIVRRAGLEDVDTSAFEPLANRLGHWPLLLELAGSSIRRHMRNGRAVGTVLARLEETLDEKGADALDISCNSLWEK